MVATLKRQLTGEEKEIILKRFGRNCFATGHAIPDDERVQFDHIRAHGLGGDSELNAKSDLKRAQGIRNGLMIVILGLTQIRLKNFVALDIGKTFKDVNGS